MAALAVHEYQHLVGAEAAQAGGVDVVGAIGNGLAGRLKRGGREAEHLGHVGLGKSFDFSGRNHVHRRGGEDIGAAFSGPRAGHHYFIQILGEHQEGYFERVAIANRRLLGLVAYGREIQRGIGVDIECKRAFAVGSRAIGSPFFEHCGTGHALALAANYAPRNGNFLRLRCKS